VNGYRANVIGEAGQIVKFRSFLCDTDENATVWAKQLADGHDVELWSGDRLVTRLRGKPCLTGEWY
jgi:hypothetical protein